MKQKSLDSLKYNTIAITIYVTLEHKTSCKAHGYIF